MVRQRADRLLVKRGVARSRTDAAELIEAGLVLAAGRPVAKPSSLVDESVPLEVHSEDDTRRYVSRGGLKLEGALREFGIDVDGMKAIDVGSSTGGFTDCLLQHGASSVAAIDVGRGQLDWKLRQDARVNVWERTNIRGVVPEDVGGPADVLVADVSFISLSKIAGRLAGLLRDTGRAIILVKPQFEAPRGAAKKGVVREPALHLQALTGVIAALGAVGLVTVDVAHSVLLGPKGNIEFFLLCRHAAVGEQPLDEAELEAKAEHTVSRAHEELVGVPEAAETPEGKVAGK